MIGAIVKLLMLAGIKSPYNRHFVQPLIRRMAMAGISDHAQLNILREAVTQNKPGEAMDITMRRVVSEAIAKLTTD